MHRALLLALAIALVTAVPAHATFEGTPGKIAFIDQKDGQDRPPLKVWDPAKDETRIIAAETYALSTQSTLSLGFNSTPVWSPDGTRLAFVKSIDGTGNSPYAILHTALYVYDLRTGETTQLTEPEPTFVDLNNEDQKFEGHTVSDYAPAWSPSGLTVAFIRSVSAYPDDVLYSKRGTNVWTVPAAGGSPVQATHYEPGQAPFLGGSMVWIPGSNDVLMGVTDQTGFKLVRQSVAGGGMTTLSTLPNIIDYDVSPDGKRFGFAALGGGGLSGFEGDLANGAATSQGAWLSPLLRYSNTGSGLLRRGCIPRDPQVCGIVEKLREDPQADIRGGEEDRMMLDWQTDAQIPGSSGSPGRILWDVQPQKLPVIFIPGFLGSEIKCGGTTAWPDVPFPDLLNMRLQADGLANADCGIAAPTGNLVESVLGSDVYKSVANHVRSEYPGGRGHLFGWDWRKRPQESFSRLRSEIDLALEAEGPWKDQQAGRVVLWGHSYGGLLIRSFVDDDADGKRVARVLTAGTPYWGSPKSIFPLAFGVESPLFSVLDAIINNNRLKAFAVNLAGLYNLYPSDRYGPWLSLLGVDQSQAGVSAFVSNLGGNAGLFEQARGYHNTLYEGFYDDDGRIDTRIVVGTGMPTIGTVSFADADGGGVLAAGLFTNGDETVPARSGTQGTPGTAAPYGDDVHVQYACNVSHVPLPGDSKVLEAYKDFIDHGAVPRKLPGPCQAKGGVYKFKAASIGQNPTKAARATGPLPLPLAEQQGLIDLIEMPAETLAVVDDDRPVTLQVPIVNGSFSYTPLQDEQRGTTRTYGPVTGLLTLAPAAPGAAPAVALNGVPLTPVGSAPSGGAGPTGGTPSAPPPSGRSPATKPAAAAKLAFVKRPKLRGRKLSLTVRAPKAGTLRVTVTQRGRKLGTASAKLRRAGRKALTVRLKRRPRGALQVVVTFKPRSGGTQRLKAKVRAR